MSRLMAIAYASGLGILIGVQLAINAGLGKISSPKSATLLNFLLGGALMLIFILFTGGIGDLALVTKAPWYLWLGGVLGLIIVSGSLSVAPVIGTGATLALLVLLQIATGLVIDHFGWFGVPKAPIDVFKVLGMVLLAAGVHFIAK